MPRSPGYPPSTGVSRSRTGYDGGLGYGSLRRQPVPAVRFEPADVRALGHDPGRINPLLRLVVMPLDLHEVGRVAKAGRLVEVPGVAPQVRVVGQPVQIALEVDVVDGVEPGQRGEQPDVGLGYLAAEQERWNKVSTAIASLMRARETEA